MKSFKDKFRYAFSGLKLGLKDQAIKIQLVLMGLAVAFAFVLKCTVLEWCIVLLCCGMVVSFEFLNSIVETIMDFMHPAYHDKVKIIKDLSAGMVLFVCIVVGIVGILLFGSKLVSIIGGII